jgi:hypothetical protein
MRDKNITRYLRSNRVKIVEFQVIKTDFYWIVNYKSAVLSNFWAKNWNFSNILTFFESLHMNYLIGF